MSSRKPATLSDVAREAGVSPFTVSAVLNGARSNTRVSPATRERIMDSAARLRYQANAQARSLARQRTNTLGVLFDVVESTAALGDNYASGILQGIVAEARRIGYDVLLYTEPWHDAERSSARFRDRRTDGVIVVAPLLDNDIMEGLSATGIPLCAISASSCPSSRSRMVDVDNAAGIRLAVEHLVSLGHRRIVHLTGNANVYSVGQREEAFRDAICRAAIPVSAESVLHCTYDASSIPDILPDLLLRAHASTAIVAGNDNIAIAALNTARALGVDVPGKLSIVGFDDIAACAQVTPPMTTIRQPLGAIGAAAVTSLIAAIEDREPGILAPEPLLVMPELIVRGSTAAATVPSGRALS